MSRFQNENSNFEYFLLEGKESDRTSIVHCIQKIVFALLIFIVILVLEMCGENFNFYIVIFCTHTSIIYGQSCLCPS